VRDAAPVISKLLADLGPLKPLATSLDQLLVSSRARGAFEGVLRVAYAFATNTSLYDSVSHILTFIVSAAPECVVGQQADLPVPGCSHRYTAAGQGSIPVNEPSCGPKNPAWFNQTCPLALPGPVSLNIATASARSAGGKAKLADLGGLASDALAGHSPPVQDLRSLLDFLLK
jgi:hypothetical protein